MTFVSVIGESEDSIEIRYEDENIWMIQKMLAELYGVSVSAINQHLSTLTQDSEIDDAVIKQYLITANDGKVSKELAKKHAETEFEKYRIIQDAAFESDFDHFVAGVSKLGKEK